MNYHFHGSGSDMPLIFSELLLNPQGWGGFDYYMVQEQDKLIGYFSDTGVKQMEEFATKNLLNASTRNDIIEGIKKFDIELQDFSLAQEYWEQESGTEERLKAFLRIVELLKAFGVFYFKMEAPWLASVDKIIESACERDGLLHDQILHNPSIAENFSSLEQEVLSTLTELGHLKLAVHTHSEPLMRALYSLLSFISKDAGIPLGYANSMTSVEIEQYLRSHTVELEKIRVRSEGAIFIPCGNGEPHRIEVGEGYRTWKTLLQPPLDGDIRGVVACRGKVQGRVTVHTSWINITEIPKGNILIAGMTNPQMVPYIKNAAAIVTDEGGLMCHAAIISREMKIPCIVGTKIATQVLKEGDLVEVDANTGVVRKLEQ